MNDISNERTNIYMYVCKYVCKMYANMYVFAHTQIDDTRIKKIWKLILLKTEKYKIFSSYKSMNIFKASVLIFCTVQSIFYL